MGGRSLKTGQTGHYRSKDRELWHFIRKTWICSREAVRFLGKCWPRTSRSRSLISSPPRPSQPQRRLQPCPPKKPPPCPSSGGLAARVRILFLAFLRITWLLFRLFLLALRVFKLLSFLCRHLRLFLLFLRK